MRQLILIIGIFTILFIPTYAQVYYDTIAWVRVNDEIF